MKLGINLGQPGSELRAALGRVSKLGVTGVQLDAVGELDPRRLSQTGLRELTHILRSYSLELTALGCPLRHGLDIETNQQQRIDHVKNVMRLSFDLGPRKVIISAGAVPAEKTPERSRMTEAVLALAQNGDRTGTTLALESGQESSDTLAGFIREFDSAGVRVNYDPANMLLHGYDPVAGLAPFKELIVHTHARDARKSGADRLALEVPIGHGDIDWMNYLATLAGMEYRGWVVIERTGGMEHWDDIAAGVGFLRRLI